MRIYLLIAFLGLWIAVVPFIFNYGSTQTAVLVVSGLLIALLSIWSLRETTTL